MKQREMNQILISTLQLQNELHDFCIEYLHELFGENRKILGHESDD